MIATSIIFLSGCKLQQENEYEENEEYDGPDKAAEFQFNRTKDPATGTGTFLAEVVKHVYKKFEGQKGIAGKYSFGLWLYRTV